MMAALVKRELQEHRAALVLPAITGAVLWALTVGAVMVGDGLREDGSTLLADIERMDAFLGGLHSLFLLVMFLFSVNYLQASLYQDRRDRSVLFWKSMPVAEWQEVASKLLFASVLVPLMFLVMSLLTQWLCALTGTAWIAYLQPDAPSLLGKVSLFGLLSTQLVGMLVWSVASLPIYAWFLLVSATVRRSPLMTAAGLPIVAYLLEGMFFGTRYVSGFVSDHLPLFSGAELLARELEGIDLSTAEGLDGAGMLLGVVISIPMLGAAIWMRKYRFEI